MGVNSLGSSKATGCRPEWETQKCEYTNARVGCGSKNTG